MRASLLALVVVGAGVVAGCATPQAPAAPVVGELPPAPEILPGATPPARLRLAEVQTANVSTWMSAPGVTPDWVEVVNLGDTPLARAEILVRVGDARGRAGTQGALAPGERLLLVADGGDGEGHLPFTLAAEGDDLELSYQGVVTDRLRTGLLGADLAWARFPASASGGGVAEGTPPRLAALAASSGERGEDASAEGGAAPGAASTGPRPRRSPSNGDREGGGPPSAPSNVGTTDLDGTWLPTARPTPGAPNGSRPPDTLDPSSLLFDTSRVHALELGLGQTARDALDANPYTDVEGTFAFEGLSYPCVTMRKKGVYGSLRTFDRKVGLKVDLNACGGNALRGLETLTLNNMVQDPSSVHEALIYGWMRSRGLPAPRTGWVRLSVDGEDFGFYVWIETPDENLLARWWSDATGNLYEGAYGVDFYPGYEPYFEADQSANPEDRSDLTAVIDVLQRTPDDDALSALEALVDLDAFLDVLAVEAIALHWDGYSTSNNYRIYRDPADGRFDLLPWGMDQTFVDRYLGPYDGRGVLFTWCLRNHACAVRYDAALLRAADDWEAHGFEARMDAYLTLVTPQVESDPRREWGMETHAAYVSATRTWMAEAPGVVREAVTARRRARAAGQVP